MTLEKIDALNLQLQQKEQELHSLNAEQVRIEEKKKQLQAQLVLVSKNITLILDSITQMSQGLNLPGTRLPNSEGMENALSFVYLVSQTMAQEKSRLENKLQKNQTLQIILTKVANVINPQAKWSGSAITVAIASLGPKKENLELFQWFMVDVLKLHPSAYDYFYIDPLHAQEKIRALQETINTRLQELRSAEQEIGKRLKKIKSCQEHLDSFPEQLEKAYLEKTNLAKQIGQQQELLEPINARQLQLPGEIDRLRDEREKAIRLAERERKARQEELQKQHQVQKEQAAQQNKEQEDRKSLVAEIKQLLTAYKVERSQRYPVKDKLSPHDKKARNDYIDGMENHFEQFITTGATAPLLCYLDKGITDFPGVHLSTQLHRATLKLLNTTPEQVEVDVARVMAELVAANPQYIANLHTLYNKIEKMADFAAQRPDKRLAVAQLATQLKKDVDYFVSQHQKSLPSRQAFLYFQTKINARLHSDDVAMSRHENWKSLALNIILAVISAGTALGIKAAYSKITTGQVAFFGQETKKQKAINDTQKTLDEVSEAIKLNL